MSPTHTCHIGIFGLLSSSCSNTILPSSLLCVQDDNIVKVIGHYVSLQYFLGRGGISAASTGSNSDFLVIFSLLADLASAAKAAVWERF